MAAARRIPVDRLPRLRAAAQLLHRPSSAGDPADIARAIAGAQAQDAYAGPLTFRSRSRKLTAKDVRRARTEEGSILRTWVMRMTIHMIALEDAGWMLPLFEPRIEKWQRRRLDQLGMAGTKQDKALRVVERVLEREGPMTRPEVAERVASAGIELNPQTRMHIAGLAVTSRIACLGPDRGRTTCLVRRDDWLGKPPRFDREKALAELARCFIGAFGPAGDRDFAYWSGLPLRDVRAGMEAIAAEMSEVRAGEETLFTLRGRGGRLPRPGGPRMLGAFDTYMLGYRDRSFAVAPQMRETVKAEAGGGLLRPVLVRDGVVVGGWSYRRKGERVEVAITRGKGLTASDRRAIEAEVADIQRFEGVEVASASM